jgi:hypothetical protein
MTFNARDIGFGPAGISVSGRALPAFVEPARITNDTTPYPLQREVLTVGLTHQVRFNLAAAPPPGAVKSLVVGKLTYFEPDFEIVGKRLVWKRGVLPLGTTLVFEAVGTDQVHRRLDVVPVLTPGQTTFELFAPPAGPPEVYVNGLRYDERAFTVRGRTIHWHEALVPGARFVVVYPITPEGAHLYQLDTVPFGPQHGSNVELSIEALDTLSLRVYFRGQRLTPLVDYAVSLDQLTILTPLESVHGDLLQVAIPTSSTFFQATTTDREFPTQVFTKANAVVTAPGTTVALPNPGDTSVLSVNGLMYAESKGYTRTPSVLTWADASLTLAAGDEFSLLGFNTPDALHVREFNGQVGYPTFDLGEKAADIRKSLVFVSAGASYGGELYAGRQYLSFPSDHEVAWTGPFPLKATDRVVVVYLRSPALAGALTIETHQVTMAEEGQPFARRMKRAPKEPSAVVAALNGARLVSPKNFTVNDDAFVYLDHDVPLAVGDVITLLYR